MKTVFISNPFSTLYENAPRDQQKYQLQPRNKRRKQQRWRRKFHRNILFRQQHMYSILHQQNMFSCTRTSLYQQTVKPITVVAGSSMASRLIERNLGTPRDIVKLTFESGCNCEKMLTWLNSIEGRHFMYGASRLILILGTNDLHVVGAEGTLYRIKQTVESIRVSFPSIMIVWQLLQWRTKATRYLLSGFDVLQEIAKCNAMLLDLAGALHFHTIDPALTRHHICDDNLLPTSYGSRVIENWIRSFLEHQWQITYSAF